MKSILFVFISAAGIIFSLSIFAKSYQAIKNGANIRIDSTSLSESIGTLSNQDLVEVIGKKYDWYKIKYRHD